jgi:hypothetical protein
MVVGDVRVTRVNSGGTHRTTCAVRRLPGRTPTQIAQLHEQLAAARDVLQREHCRRRVLLRNNFAFQDNRVAAAHAEVAYG